MSEKSQAQESQETQKSQAQELAEATGSRRLGKALNEFPWIHLGLGLIGNASFFIGSIFFFWEATKTEGIWLFVIGSLGMLLGSLGEYFVRVEKKRHGLN